jgi:hypothetical protein
LIIVHDENFFSIHSLSSTDPVASPAVILSRIQASLCNVISCGG